jgi:hypothetical protein
MLKVSHLRAPARSDLRRSVIATIRHAMTLASPYALRVVLLLGITLAFPLAGTVHAQAATYRSRTVYRFSATRP